MALNLIFMYTRYIFYPRYMKGEKSNVINYYVYI